MTKRTSTDHPPWITTLAVSSYGMSVPAVGNPHAP